MIIICAGVILVVLIYFAWMFWAVVEEDE